MAINPIQPKHGRQGVVNDRKKSTYSVLIIDDEKEIQEIVSLGLAKMSDLDLFISSASDGVEGLKLSEDFEFDAIITDYFMPNMDGVEFIEKFRKLSHNKKKPIIFTSGYFSELDFKKNEGLFEDVIFLEKPYKISDVNSFLKIYLESTKLG
ncbi:MAG: response regulator [Oligoflexales bacterium]